MHAKNIFEDPRTLVEDGINVVVFPPAAARLLELLNDPDANSEAVAATLSLDPALAARVLRVANSPLYSGRSQIESVPRAVTVLGRELLSELVLGAGVVSAFDALEIEAVSIEAFWRHSLYCGAFSAVIARLSRPQLKGSAFAAGLMHDIGQLMLFVQQPAAMREVLMEVALSGDDLAVSDVERATLGFDHCDVGRELALSWNMPEGLSACMSQHHEPDFSAATAQLVSIVHIASVASVMLETDESLTVHDAVDIGNETSLAGHSNLLQLQIVPDAWPAAGIKPADLPDLARDAGEYFSAMKTVLLQ